jgi:hypothetical protein
MNQPLCLRQMVLCLPCLLLIVCCGAAVWAIEKKRMVAERRVKLVSHEDGSSPAVLASNDLHAASIAGYNRLLERFDFRI